MRKQLLLRAPLPRWDGLADPFRCHSVFGLCEPLDGVQRWQRPNLSRAVAPASDLSKNPKDLESEAFRADVNNCV